MKPKEVGLLSRVVGSIDCWTSFSEALISLISPGGFSWQSQWVRSYSDADSVADSRQHSGASCDSGCRTIGNTSALTRVAVAQCRRHPKTTQQAPKPEAVRMLMVSTQLGQQAFAILTFSAGRDPAQKGSKLRCVARCPRTAGRALSQPCRGV